MIIFFSSSRHAQYAKSLALGHDKPIQIRHYGDHKKEVVAKYNRKGPSRVRSQTALVKGMYPRIPSVMEEERENKKQQQLFLTAIPDGTTIV
jgi:hypothetical protein